MNKELPVASREEQVYSEKLGFYLLEKMAENGGSIPFSEFFHEALYHPDYGYYTNGLPIFGREGDFVTAPLISPFFSYALANQVKEIGEQLGSFAVLEIGAGNGTMAKDLLLHLQKVDSLPAKYYILELSQDLRVKQYDLLSRYLPDYIDNVQWLDEPPQFSWRGVILANEVVDALTVERFTIHNGEPHYIDVGYQQNDENKTITFCDVLRRGDEELRAFIREREDNGIVFEEGYCSEYCKEIITWLPSLFAQLTEGVGIFIDYGYEEAEYYRAERRTGTLIAHYRHHAHEDFYLYPGLQDLTANVNFTQLAEVGVDEDLLLLGYTTQNFFLYGCGLEKLLTDTQPNVSEVEWYRILQSIQELVLPTTMGERFKVMAFGKNYTKDLCGFDLYQHDHLL